MEDDGGVIGAGDIRVLARGDAIAAVFVAALSDEGADAFDALGTFLEHVKAAHDAIGGFEVGAHVVVFLAIAAVEALAVLERGDDLILAIELSAEAQQGDRAAAGGAGLAGPFAERAVVVLQLANLGDPGV